MKSKKSYCTYSIITPMIFFPVLLTLGIILFVFIITPFLSSSPNLSASKDYFKFILSLEFFLGSSILGGILGILFSKSQKAKPDKAVERYLWPLIPIIYALFFVFFAYNISPDNYKTDYWNLYIFKNPAFLIIDFFISLDGNDFVIPILEISGYIGFFLGIILHEQFSKTYIKSKAAVNMRILFIALCGVFVFYINLSMGDMIHIALDEIRYGRSTVSKELTEFDLAQIAPFKKDNHLAQLDKTASLQFNSLDEMPKLDGATAAFPIYSAFVEAVYKGLGDYHTANSKNDSSGNTSDSFVSNNSYPYNIIKCSKTTAAYEELIQKRADIIFVAEPSKAQVEAVKSKGDEFVLTPIGNEAFVFFNNIRNPVTNLSIKQIQDIYSGNITNWKELGGNNKKIIPYQRPENSGSQTILENKVMKSIKIMPPTTETGSSFMGGMIKDVASYRNAKNSIGFSFLYYSSSMVKSNQIKYISIDGVAPSSETIRNKKYPFTILVYAVTLKSNTNKNVSKSIEWILSEEGQSLIAKTGYVSVR